MTMRYSDRVEDIVLIDKPKGISSAVAVAIVKRQTRARKAGHAGTLDPQATGLLIIGLNRGTKKLAEYLKLPKTYEADILLGKRTDTGDLEGKVVEACRLETIDRGTIEKIVRGMEGELMLQVPIYSALKRNGTPLYKLARKGKDVEAPVRTMLVRQAELLSIDGPLVRVRFDVGSGTYIRSLAEELGRRLGYPAALSGLRRTKIGGFEITDAQTITP